MVDDGELDWKLIAINSKDPLAAQLDDISDVESKMPGVVSGKSFSMNRLNIEYLIDLLHFYYYKRNSRMV